MAINAGGISHSPHISALHNDATRSTLLPAVVLVMIWCLTVPSCSSFSREPSVETEPVTAGMLSVQYPFDDFTELWIMRGGSNPNPNVGMEFFGTNWIGVSPFEVDTAYSPALLNDSNVLPSDSKILVHVYKPLIKERTFRNITDAAREQLYVMSRRRGIAV